MIQTRLRAPVTGLRTFAPKIVFVLSKLKASGLNDSTVKGLADQLKHLAEHSNLDDPRDVKRFIASKPVANSYRHNLVKAYNYYVLCHGMTWTRPKYRFERQVPKIPTHEVLTEIIGRAGAKYRVVFWLLADTGAMPIELCRVQPYRDIDLDKGTITIQGSKGHCGRIHKLKPSLVATLRTYLSKYDAFPKPETLGRTWRKYRNRAAEQLENPSIRKIRLYDLRHYFGTMTYHKTKDVLYTEQQMGHKKIETTLMHACI